MKKTSVNKGYTYAILAAVFFGASTPAAKFLLQGINPWLLAGLFYLGSAIGLIILFSVQVFFPKSAMKEASLKYKDLLWLGSAIFLGGIIGSVLLMTGLVSTHASSATLLLNLALLQKYVI